MADFQTSYLWMMQNEDSGLQYKTVPDVGGFAISGINSHDYPEDFAKINALLQDQRGPAVHSFYQVRFWNQWYAQLVSDDLAKRVFDGAVNMGPGTTVVVLQKAVNSLGGTLTIDGGWGVNTLQAVNTQVPGVLIPAYQAQRVQHYKDIVAKNPNDAQYLPVWIARAQK